MNERDLSSHIRSILEFWTPALDWKAGGIHFLMRDFGKGPDRRSVKNLLMHVRQLYDFSVGHERGYPGATKAARHLSSTLDPLFLKPEKLYASYHQPEGNWRREGFSAYDQFYCVVGISRFARAFRDKQAWRKARDLFFRAMTIFGHGATFRTQGLFASWNPSKRRWHWKSGNALLHLYESLVNLGLACRAVFGSSPEGEREFKALEPVFEDCYHLITRKIYSRKHRVMLEDFEDDLTPGLDQEYGCVTNAHALEWIGFMIEASLLTGKNYPFLGKEGKKLADISFERAASRLNGFRNDYFLHEKTSTEDVPFWAQIESILTACFLAKWWKDNSYLLKARKLWDFYGKYFLDRKFGGIYSAVSCHGVATDRRKGHAWKCDHHNLRVCEKILDYGLLSERPLTLPESLTD